MRRRDFFAFLGGALALRPFAARAQQPDRSRHVSTLEEAKRDYAKISPPSEAARSDYITRLVRMREKAARLKTDEWQVIDTEIKQHPAPKDSDSKSLSARLVGRWASPRHDYLYRVDGTWTMLPADENTTHGRWRIEGNQFFNSAATEKSDTAPYTIILINKKTSCSWTNQPSSTRSGLNSRTIPLDTKPQCQLLRLFPRLRPIQDDRVDGAEASDATLPGN